GAASALVIAPSPPRRARARERRTSSLDLSAARLVLRRGCDPKGRASRARPLCCRSLTIHASCRRERGMEPCSGAKRSIIFGPAGVTVGSAGIGLRLGRAVARRAACTPLLQLLRTLEIRLHVLQGACCTKER